MRHVSLHKFWQFLAVTAVLRQTNSFEFHKFNPTQYGCLFGDPHDVEKKGPPLPNICHTYPTMTKYRTLIPYLKDIKKVKKSRNTLLNFC